MRNVGSLMSRLLRPSLQKNVAGLGLRQGVLPTPRGWGGAWAALPRSARTLMGGGSLGSWHPCSFVVMGSSQGGPNPACFLHQTWCQAWIPQSSQTTCFCCYLEMGGGAKIYFVFSKLKNKLLLRVVKEFGCIHTAHAWLHRGEVCFFSP